MEKKTEKLSPLLKRWLEDTKTLLGLTTKGSDDYQYYLGRHSALLDVKLISTNVEEVNQEKIEHYKTLVAKTKHQYLLYGFILGNFTMGLIRYVLG